MMHPIDRAVIEAGLAAAPKPVNRRTRIAFGRRLRAVDAADYPHKLSDDMLQKLIHAAANVQRRASKLVAFNGKLHGHLTFTGRSFPYHSKLPEPELKTLLNL